MTRKVVHLANRFCNFLPHVRDAASAAALAIQEDRLCLQTTALTTSVTAPCQGCASALSFSDAGSCQQHISRFTQVVPLLHEPSTLEIKSESGSLLVARAIRERLAGCVDAAVLNQSWPSNNVVDKFPGRAATFGGYSALVGVSSVDSSQCRRRSSSRAATAPAAAVEESSNVVDQPGLSLDSIQGDVRDESLDSNRGPLHEYKRRIRAGLLRPADEFQEETMLFLQQLYDELMGAGGHTKFSLPRARRRGAFLSVLLQLKQEPAAIKGLYLWGGVGTGKTMMMDLFFDELPMWIAKKRTHFHDFMLTVHSQLQHLRGRADPLLEVAKEMREEVRVLCLDEFMVSDVADAMILNRLFKHLFDQGIVLISTSNRPPVKLYENGLQRDLFLPFIALLQQQCVVHEFKSATDYRKLAATETGWYFTGPRASERLRERVKALTGGSQLQAEEVQVVMGRMLKIPRVCNGVALFSFYELCEVPLGAADYFGLCRNAHTIAVDGVPLFSASNRGAAYRFVTLVDVLYDNKARILCAAEGSPAELFARVVTVADAPKRTSSRSSRFDDADVAVDNELGFAKDRTISRLTEMQSTEYEEHHAHTVALLDEHKGTSKVLQSVL